MPETVGVLSTAPSQANQARWSINFGKRVRLPTPAGASARSCQVIGSSILYGRTELMRSESQSLRHEKQPGHIFGRAGVDGLR
jgi:hypothetical protein